METVRFILGIAGSLGVAFGAVLYIWSIWHDDSKPEFWTWLIFAIGASGAAAYTLEGHPGKSGAIFPVAVGVLIDLIFIHTWVPKFRYREGDEVHADEKLARWWHKVFVVPAAVLFYSLLIGLHWPALAGVLGAIAVDFTALSMLAVKCRRKPDTEWWPPYACATIGGILGLAALQNWSFTTAAFPAYFAVTEAWLVYILRHSESEAVPQVAGA